MMLKTAYKFIYFEEVSWTEGKNRILGWYCYNKVGDIIGRVGYYAKWRKWVFTARDETIIFDTLCLADISHFLKQLDED